MMHLVACAVAGVLLQVAADVNSAVAQNSQLRGAQGLQEKSGDDISSSTTNTVCDAALKEEIRLLKEENRRLRAKQDENKDEGAKESSKSVQTSESLTPDGQTQNQTAGHSPADAKDGMTTPNATLSEVVLGNLADGKSAQIFSSAGSCETHDSQGNFLSAIEWLGTARHGWTQAYQVAVGCPDEKRPWLDDKVRCSQWVCQVRFLCV